MIQVVKLLLNILLNRISNRIINNNILLLIPNLLISLIKNIG